MMNSELLLKSPAGEAIGLKHGIATEGGTALTVHPAAITSGPAGNDIDRGALLILIDQSMGWLIRTTAEADVPIVTVDLRVDWVQTPVPTQSLTSEAKIIGRRGRILILRADVRGEGGAIIATGIGQFMVGDPAASPPDLPQDLASFFKSSPAKCFSEYLKLEEGPERFVVRPQVSFMGAIQMASYHGGVVAAALHNAAELWSAQTQSDAMTCTNISIQYLRLARATEALEIEIGVTRMGRTVAVLSATARHPGDPKPVAVATIIMVATGQGGELSLLSR